VLLFVVLNPGLKRFYEYSNSGENYQVQRKYNFIVCSVYDKEIDNRKETYFGILSNFIDITERVKSQVPSITHVHVDSAITERYDRKQVSQDTDEYGIPIKHTVKVPKGYVLDAK